MFLYDKKEYDLNKGFYNYLDENFELACQMSERDFEYNELINLLQNGNIPEKQIAALKLVDLKTKNDAEILVSNLTGCDGKIREAVALKINQFLKKGVELTYFNYPQIFADASIDINGNICRLVIDSVEILKQHEDFANEYIHKILSFIEEAFKALDEFIFRDKKYVINKQLFKLYWSLEALILFAEEMDSKILLPILERASQEKEYTIREKVAQILVLKTDFIYEDLKNILKNDENYYVRNVFKS